MSGDILYADTGASRPYVIVLGNEKGGTGKSTTAIHLIVALLEIGYTVGSIDLDSRQATLSRYIANRVRFAEETGRNFKMPIHHKIERSEATDQGEAEAEEKQRMQAAFADMAGCNFIVIDTPGSDSYLSRLGHVNADTLITPLNDSFLDIDVLARIDREKREVSAPSVYSQMVWEQNNRRVVEGQRPIDWIVMRNRLTHIEARNKREIGLLLMQLAKRIGFRVAPGFGERVIFRELFHKGLTLLDLPDDEGQGLATSSHFSARQELRTLLEVIGLLESSAA